MVLTICDHATGDTVSLFAGKDYSSNHALVDYRVKQLAYACIEAVHQNRLAILTPLTTPAKFSQIAEIQFFRMQEFIASLCVSLLCSLIIYGWHQNFHILFIWNHHCQSFILSVNWSHFILHTTVLFKQNNGSWMLFSFNPLLFLWATVLHRLYTFRRELYLYLDAYKIQYSSYSIRYVFHKYLLYLNLLVLTFERYLILVGYTMGIQYSVSIR